MTRLTYFSFEGRAEATRLAFVVGDQDFEDRRFGFSEFETIQKEEAPWEIVPFLTIDGLSYAHSTALLRYAGKKSGIYPEDAFEALKVDEIVMAGEDFFALVYSCWRDSPERQKVLGAEMAEGKLSKWLKVLDKKMSDNASSPFFVGSSLTIADLQIFCVLRLLADTPYIPASVVEDNAPNLKAFYDAVMDHPKIKAYYASRA